MGQARERDGERTRRIQPEPPPAPSPQAEHPLRKASERLARRTPAESDSALQRLLWFQVSQAMFAPPPRRGRPKTVCGARAPRPIRARTPRPDL